MCREIHGERTHTEPPRPLQGATLPAPSTYPPTQKLSEPRPLGCYGRLHHKYMTDYTIGPLATESQPLSPPPEEWGEGAGISNLLFKVGTPCSQSSPVLIGAFQSHIMNTNLLG